MFRTWEPCWVGSTLYSLSGPGKQPVASFSAFHPNPPHTTASQWHHQGTTAPPPSPFPLPTTQTNPSKQNTGILAATIHPGAWFPHKKELPWLWSLSLA